MPLVLTLPFPPSVNNYWTFTRRGVFISDRGQSYRDTTILLSRSQRRQQGSTATLRGRVKVHVVAFCPDHRAHDLDNLMKATLDALQYAGIFENDGKIDDLHIVRGAVKKGGELSVTVESLP